MQPDPQDWYDEATEDKTAEAVLTFTPLGRITKAFQALSVCEYLAGSTFVFKTAHYAERLKVRGLVPSEVEAIVQQALSKSRYKPGTYIHGGLEVKGVPVEFRAQVLESGTVNVGTIYPRK